MVGKHLYLEFLRANHKRYVISTLLVAYSNENNWIMKIRDFQGKTEFICFVDRYSPASLEITIEEKNWLFACRG